MQLDLIAIDLDDTLLREDLTISKKNKTSIIRLRNRGTKIVLASGRNIHSMRAYAEELGILTEDDYMVCSNGAEIIHGLSGRVINEIRMEAALCRRIADIIDAEGAAWQIYEGGLIYVSRQNDYSHRDSALTGQKVKIVEDRERFFTGGILKFVVAAEPQIVQTLKKAVVQKLPGEIEIVVSKPYFLEILPLGADKGKALLRLCDLLGLSIDRSMAIGDAMNDAGMMRVVGFPCVPANAMPELKTLARYFAKASNEEDAVAELIDHISALPENATVSKI